jgi:hypothetical protein
LRCLPLLAGAAFALAASASADEKAKPVEIVLVEPDAVDAGKAAGWEAEGFAAVALVLDERYETAVVKRAADAADAAGMGVYLWIEVGRNQDLAKQHPEWLASLGMHGDWRSRFPKVRPLEKGEVAKAWPWVPIGYKESFDAHRARVGRLLERAPAGFRGVLLNDLQGGPGSCGCGNLQCRWAIDYHVPSTATVLAEAAPKFVAEVEKLLPGKQVIPVWTTECEAEDMPAAKRPAGSWGTGLCGNVPCFDYCRARFAEQWVALQTGRAGPTAVLALHRELQRDRPEYGGPAAWVGRAVDYCEKQKGAATVPPNRLWVVVQGYDVPAEETVAARKAAGRAGAGAIVVARARLDQSYEPRIFAPK